MPLCSIGEVQLRFLCPDDLQEVRTLCQDWFPIDYPMSWYEDITSSTRFYALAAVYNFTIIGLIVAEIKQFTNLNKEVCNSIIKIISFDNYNVYKFNKNFQDLGILPDWMGRDAEVGYILSLGVHKKHRRNGIGSLLLDSLINHLTTAERHKVKAIFLHVLTTNQPAILFYEKRRYVNLYFCIFLSLIFSLNFRFILHSFLPYYYSIRGKRKDGFTYVSYINGGHPPWTL